MLNQENNKLFKSGDVFAQNYTIIEPHNPIPVGQAYKANDIRSNKSVVIKVLQLEKPIDPTSKKQFLHDTDIICSLKHLNIIPLHDAGILQNKIFYLVEDYLENSLERQTLTYCINGAERRRICWQEGVPIFLQVCQALDHVHKEGIIHRNLNPNNIRVTLDSNDELLARVTNFSIAPFVEIFPSEKTRFVDRSLFSDPTYTSPEQCQAKEPDQRSDIYSLGCIMYEAFCGVPPCADNDYLGIIDMHINSCPTAMSEIAPLSIYLEAIVIKCLQKKPDERFQSAKELLDELEAFHEEEKIKGTPAWLKRVSQRFSRALEKCGS